VRPSPATNLTRYTHFAVALSFGLACSHSISRPSQQDCHVPTSVGAPPTPVLVLLELSPWLMVVNSDVPSFALYADGTVFYAVRDQDGGPTGDFRQGRLSPSALNQFFASLPLDALARLTEHYASSYSSDQRTNVVVWWSGPDRHRVSVYGPVLGVANSAAGWTIAASPSEFVDVYQRLVSFQLPESEPFAPQVVEAMFTPFEYSKGPSWTWPETWPGFDSPSAQRPTATHAGRIFLRGSCWSALVGAERLVGQRGAVVLDGHKYGLGARYVLPNEKAWVRSLPSAH
jgi:hypothetical protein